MVRRRTSNVAVTGVGTVSPCPTPFTATIGGSSSCQPWQLVLSPDGLFAYIACSLGNFIGQFSRDPETGHLTGLSPDTVSSGGSGRNPRGVCISPDGKFVYAAHFSDLAVGIYARNTSTGLLSAVVKQSCGSQPFNVALSPDGLFLYVSHGNQQYVSQFSVNTTTGALTALSPATVATANPGGTNVSGGQGIGMSPNDNGAFLYIANNNNCIQQFSRDTSTGLLTALTPPAVTSSTWPAYVCMPANGQHLYVANDTSASVGQFSRDTSTGLLTALSPATITSINGPFGIAISPNDANVYMPGSDGNQLGQFTRNTSTGLLTKKTPFYIWADPTVTSVSASVAGPYGVTASPDGKHLYVCMASQGRIAQFNIHA